MATGGPGGNFRGWTPTPPERGLFPLDHLKECEPQMMDYLRCMKYTENKNAPNCRVMAKRYLKCRMDNELMDESDWESLGLTNLPDDPAGRSSNTSRTQPEVSQGVVETLKTQTESK